MYEIVGDKQWEIGQPFRGNNLKSCTPSQHGDCMHTNAKANTKVCPS